MANETVGKCACPLCGAPDAEVRKGSKGRHYVVCDSCVSNIRTMSREGDRKILALLTTQPAPTPAPVPTPKPTPAPTPTPKKKLFEDLGI